MQHLEAKTSDGTVFSRGYNYTSTFGVTQHFSEQAPLIGFQGFETADKIKGLGFITYDCASSSPDDDSYFYGDSLSPEEGSQAVSQAIPKDTVLTASVSVALFLVLLFSTIALMTCLCCCCVYCLLQNRQRSRRPQVRRDLSLIMKQNKIENLDDNTSSKFEDTQNYSVTTTFDQQ